LVLLREKTLNIVVIEDHADLRDVMVEALSQEGYQVQGIASAEEFAEKTAWRAVDLMIVDLNLPGEDGLSLVSRVRQTHPDIGVIMVTARSLPTDREVGYDSGADIYMTKPVALDELKAAIRALLKRLKKPEGFTEDKLLTLDVAGGCLLGLAGQIVHLSRAEISILTALTRAQQNRLEAWQLMEAMGKNPNVYAKAALEVVIVRLRKRIRDAGADESAIRSIRNWGYQIHMPLRVI